MIDIIEYLETQKRKYPMAFTFNVMEEIQETYGTMERWQHEVLGEKEVKELDKKGIEHSVWEQSGEPSLKAIKFCLTKSINEGIDIENEKGNEKISFVTEKQVGRIMTEIGLEKITEKIFELVEKSNSTGDEEEKN